jgi:tetratricopeptide (TPR) repeat protein
MTLRAAFLLGCMALMGAHGAWAEPSGGPAAAVGQAEALFNRGNAHRRSYLRALAQADAPGSGEKGEDIMALEAYSAALRLRPDFAEAYVNRAAVHFERGDYARAIADCDAAIRLDPQLAEAFNNRSLAYYRSNRYAEAKADFDRTIQLHQHYGNAMIVRTLPDVTVAPGPASVR